MPDGDETVVLVPGLWVHARFMLPMQRRIERCGYHVTRFSYRSMRNTLTDNAHALAAFCAALPASRLHLVGHSMGGLVALAALAQLSMRPPARVVLVGTPFAPSYSAQKLLRLPGGPALLGRCMREWLASAMRSAGQGCEIGVIAGDLSIGLGRIVAPDLARPNDGVVSVDETRVPGMRDHVVLHVSHTAMLFSAEVARKVCLFLDAGRFRSKPKAD
jgi:pimeloyl-ACP methyl ester carboxylesterase